MGNIIEIPHLMAGFTSVYDNLDTVFDQNLSPVERVWSSSNHQPQVLEVQFDGIYEVTRITARQISSDQTTQGLKHWFYPRLRAGQVHPSPVNGVWEVNVGRSETDYGYSYDNDPVTYPLHEGWALERKSVGPMDAYLDKPVTAVGMQLRIEGHGWFRCEDIRFYGQLERRLTGMESDSRIARIVKDYPVLRFMD